VLRPAATYAIARSGKRLPSNRYRARVQNRAR
jgi:hypothetical protein